MAKSFEDGFDGSSSSWPLVAAVLTCQWDWGPGSESRSESVVVHENLIIVNG